MSHGHGHGHGDHGSGDNKRIAIMIAILALFLSLAETAAKSAQTDALKYNIEAANLWAFFQAKTIRRTQVETAAQAMEIDLKLAKDDAVKKELEGRIGEWKKIAQRYRSEPETNEGSQELAKRAQEAEKKHKKALEKYHHYEVSSAAFQIAIVLASAAIITGAAWLLLGCYGLAGLGLFFLGVGIFKPELIHIL